MGLFNYIRVLKSELNYNTWVTRVSPERMNVALSFYLSYRRGILDLDTIWFPEIPNLGWNSSPSASKLSTLIEDVFICYLRYHTHFSIFLHNNFKFPPNGLKWIELELFHHSTKTEQKNFRTNSTLRHILLFKKLTMRDPNKYLEE